VSSERRIRITEDSVKLCQVGIEHRHSVLKENSAMSSERRNRITEDSEISSKWASSECIGAQEKEIELLNVLGKDTLLRGNRDSVKIGIGEKRTLLSSMI
jgi:hypothetical protein